ncbi:MAG: anthranilate synthase component I family protein [Pirellulales bacterium]|nr:anthranilate synthase component I family protein [Pirellulales bacterium]
MAIQFPLVEPLVGKTSDEVFGCLSRLPHVIFLDSALADKELGRYSFVAADPYRWIERPVRDDQDALAEFEDFKTVFQSDWIRDLPPFQGGLAGLFGYEMARGIERIPAARYDEFQIPALAVGLYDVVIGFDHMTNDAWIISQGFPECEPRARRHRAAARLQWFRKQLISRGSSAGNGGQGGFRPALNRSECTPGTLAKMDLCPQFPAGQIPGLTSNFSRDAYFRAVERTIDWIYAGDIFQANISQRLLHPAIDDSIPLYMRLRQCNAAPFAGYFDAGAFQVISASPERFLCVRAGRVQTRPIKGTRPRTMQPEADLFAGNELRQNEKDRAENVMIVDLLRNDLSRVCQPDSVRVTQLCELENYAYVQHLVSSVEGDLRAENTPLDLLRASFPGGSITGAPKIRAMEIIAELEPTARGAYCGALGYIGPGYQMDTSILIRTITAARGWWQIPVGGGIVAQSDPRLEYEETWHKAEGMLRAIGGAMGQGSFGSSGVLPLASDTG